MKQIKPKNYVKSKKLICEPDFVMNQIKRFIWFMTEC